MDWRMRVLVAIVGSPLIMGSHGQDRLVDTLTTINPPQGSAGRAALAFVSSRSLPSLPWHAGHETEMQPWSAPRGHHQPVAGDVPALTPDEAMDEENSRIDHKISGICRGC